MGESTRTTGNDPVEGLDPGGTHSTHPGKPTPGGPATDRPVQSGDQNEHPDRNTEKD